MESLASCAANFGCRVPAVASGFADGFTIGWKCRLQLASANLRSFCRRGCLNPRPAEELKYILLHELAHLGRRDDWTNLAQKVLKALFFFLPSVWWIERRLSLDREMACDDAVLAHSGTPRGYAECLAHVAERSFLRRQIALAQAAVGRVRQLTTRVAMILDPNRPPATQLWKPAIPVVILLAGLSALPASFTPSLVNFADDAPAMQQKQCVVGAASSRRR